MALGPMMDTINDSLKYLHDDDLHAMAAYLKSVAAKQSVSASASSKDLPESVADAHAYQTHCSSCHQLDGKGIPGAIPALAGNGAVTSAGPENVIRVVLGGLPASHGLAPMTAVGQAMSDADVAAAVNYVRSSWGNTAPKNAGPGLVGQLRAKTQTMLAGNNTGGCPSIADPSLAKAVSSVQAQLKGVDRTNMLQTIDTILPKLKAADSGAKDDDLVNGLTIGYCPIVFADNKIPAAQRPIELGNFSGLVYGQLAKTKPN